MKLRTTGLGEAKVHDIFKQILVLAEVKDKGETPNTVIESFRGASDMGWKRVLWIVLFLVIGVGAVLCLLLSVYDFSAVKLRVLQAAREAIGREFRVEGDFKIKLGLTPTLLAERVHLPNVSWGARPEMASVESLEVRLALWPLLRKRLVIKKLVLIEPDILLERGSSGRWNFGCAPDRGAKPERSPSGRASRGQPMLQQVKALLIRDAKVTYADHRTGRSHAFFVRRLRAVAEDPDQPAAMEVTGEYGGRLFHVTGHLDPWTALTTRQALRQIDLHAASEGASIHIQGEMKGGFDKPELAVDIEASGPAFLQAVEKLGLTRASLWKPFRASGRIVREDGRWQIPRLAVAAGRADRAEIRLSGSVDRPLARRGIAIDVAVRGAGLENLRVSGLRGLPYKGPFTFIGRLTDVAPHSYRIANLKAAVAESEVHGWCAVDLAAATPRLTGEFASHTIDLRPFFPHPKDGAQARSASPQSDGEDRVFSSRPLPRPPRMIEADLNVKVDNLLLPHGRVEDLQAKLRLHGGTLAVQPLKAKICGGRLSAKIDVRTSNNGLGVNTRLRAEDLEAACVFDQLGAVRYLEGQLGVLADLQGEGESSAGLMASLQGEASFILGKGWVRNREIEVLGADLGSTLLQLLSAGDEDSERTELNCLVGLFDAKDGKGRMARLIMDTPRMRLIGSGTIDLRDESLDLRFKPTPKKGILGVSISPATLTQSVKLSGTLRHPTLAVSPIETAVNVGKALGGFLLLGPAGLATLLTSGCASDDNPCVSAIEEDRGEPDGNSPKSKEDTGKVEEAVGRISQGIESAVKRAGDTFKALLEGEGGAAARRNRASEAGF